MLRKETVLAAILGFATFGHNALAQEVFSFYATGLEPVVIPQVPGNDVFIVTDVATKNTGIIYELEQVGGNNPGLKALVNHISGIAPHTGFTSGLRLESGASLVARRTTAGQSINITISGYIRGPSTAGIPALGNVGLGFLIATLAAGGGWVISKRKAFDSALVEGIQR